jgi:hypothetical protein
MEIAVSDDETFYALHAESALSTLVEAVPVSLQLQQVDPLILILQELDDLIESEGGLLIP